MVSINAESTSVRDNFSSQDQHISLRVTCFLQPPSDKEAGNPEF